MDQSSSDDWVAFYMEHSKALTEYAAKLTGSRDEAADIVQEAFLHLRPKALDQPIPPKSYLYSIVRNLIYNRRRHAAVQKAQQSDDLPWWAKYQPVATPEEQAVFNDQAKHIARVIEGLPPKTRAVIELYRFDGLTLQEIADRLDISAPTVHRLLKEGMESIRKWMRRG